MTASELNNCTDPSTQQTVTDGLSAPPPIQAASVEAGSSPRNEMVEMLSELVHYHELLWQMVIRDLKLRYKQAVMGFAWAIFMPLMIVGAGFLVKYAMAQAAGEELLSPGISGMTVKALGWAFFVGSVGFAVNSLTSNITLVTKIYFPREVFPLSAVITQGCDTLIGSLAVGAILILFVGVGVSWTWLWLLLLVALLFLFTAAASMFFSCGNVFFRDVKYIVQVLLTFGIFFTPVFYEPQFFGPRGCQLMMLNPLSPLLEGLRLAVVAHHNLLEPLTVVTPAGVEILAWSPWHLVYAAVWSVVGFFGAWYVFHRLEFVYAEYI